MHAFEPPLASRSVLLRHDLPDGSSHFDWMMQRAGPVVGEGRLVTFRVSVPIQDAAAFDAERIPDHRAIYLDYEGEVSGGRGQVRRECLAVCNILVETERSFIVDIAFSGHEPVRLEGTPVSGSLWTFFFRRIVWRQADESGMVS